MFYINNEGGVSDLAHGLYPLITFGLPPIKHFLLLKYGGWETMKFTFAESVKLATKGFKPGDISELSELDENKFSKEDILSLVGHGYSKSDIKNLVETFSDDASEDDPGDGSDETNDHTEKPEKKSSREDPDEETSDETDDNIDYKALYEKEKKLREKLQHKNTSGSADIKRDSKTDFDIALEIANSI